MEERSRAARVLLSAQARVSHALLASGDLDEGEWARVATACEVLAGRHAEDTPDRGIFLTASTSAYGIAQAVRNVEASICVVTKPERLADGVLAPSWDELADAMELEPFAMVLLSACACDRADAAIISEDTRGRTISLFAPDPIDLIRHTHASVDIMCRVLR